MFGGLPDEQLGEKLALVLEGEERTLEPNIFDELDKYERPKAIHFVPKFAETENGKMIRKEILKEAAN